MPQSYDINIVKYLNSLSPKFQSNRHMIGIIFVYCAQGISTPFTLHRSSRYLFHLQHSEKCDATERYALAKGFPEQGIAGCGMRCAFRLC